MPFTTDIWIVLCTFHYLLSHLSDDNNFNFFQYCHGKLCEELQALDNDDDQNVQRIWGLYCFYQIDRGNKKQNVMFKIIQFLLIKNMKNIEGFVNKEFVRHCDDFQKQLGYGDETIKNYILNNYISKEEFLDEVAKEKLNNDGNVKVFDFFANMIIKNDHLNKKELYKITDANDFINEFTNDSIRHEITDIISDISIVMNQPRVDFIELYRLIFLLDVQKEKWKSIKPSTTTIPKTKHPDSDDDISTTKDPVQEYISTHFKMFDIIKDIDYDTYKIFISEIMRMLQELQKDTNMDEELKKKITGEVVKDFIIENLINLLEKLKRDNVTTNGYDLIFSKMSVFERQIIYSHIDIYKIIDENLLNVLDNILILPYLRIDNNIKNEQNYIEYKNATLKKIKEYETELNVLKKEKTTFLKN